MAVNKETIVCIYTHSFMILWYELPCQTSARSLVQLPVPRHPPIRTPSAQTVLPLRGWPTLIGRETEFLPASDQAKGDRKVIGEDYAGHNKHNTETESGHLTNAINFDDAHFYTLLPCFTCQGSVSCTCFIPPVISAVEHQSNITNDYGFTMWLKLCATEERIVNFIT